jgi:hypothetical protein
MSGSIRPVWLLALPTLALLLLPASASAATTYPWCGHYMMQNGPQNCGFTTLAQCQATVSGIGGFCAANPSYLPIPQPNTKGRRTRQT